MRFLACFVSLLIFTGATFADTQRILVMGDSMMASHKITGRSVAGNLRKLLDQPVIDHSRPGARMIYKLPISGAVGFSIPKQYKTDGWDWVILNGGGNDLWLGCGCGNCKRKLNKLISKDGKTGTIPTLLEKIRHTRTRIIYVGYLRSPGVNSPVDACRTAGDELERRITTFAQNDAGTTFLSLKDMVPNGDRSYHMADMIHPSLKASKEIARKIHQTLSRN